MKLISLHIENFGCLQDYDLKFGDGLTVIREPNGFGKTTLAEFIRAMFYGFPRAAKTLDKNKRKKYIPWGGGKCGGHLTFAFEGTAYRIERTFGVTPRGDSFNLIDLNTNKKSTRFSENIGVELFRLDAESFERSTYMPQFHELGSLSTDSIRAKLGDLVEDTNDINNFDKAVTALKNKRSSLVPYRGSGGSVAEARTQVSRLQEELDRTERKRERLAAVQAEITGLEAELDRSNGKLTSVREQITRASQAAADALVRRQYESLLAQQEKASETVGKERRFADGVPSADAFEEARQDCGHYLDVCAELRSVGLTTEEQTQLAELDALFKCGVPGEEKLDELKRLQMYRLQLQTAVQSQKLSDGEHNRLKALKRCFEQGVPEEKSVDEARRSLERAHQLRQENLRLAAASPSEKQTGGKIAVIALILGTLCLAAGIGLMAARYFVPGGVLMGIGLLALIGGVYLGIKRMVSRELSGAAAENRARMDANEAEAAGLERYVRNFASRYSEKISLTEALSEIWDRRAEYLTLLAHERSLTESRTRTSRELEKCTAILQQELAPYFGESCNFEQSILELQIKRRRMLDLAAKKDAAEEKENALRRQAGKLRQKLDGFLAPYYKETAAGDYHSLLSELQRDCDEYTRVQARLAELTEQAEAFHAEHRAVLDTSGAEDAADLDALKQAERRLSVVISDVTRRVLEQKHLASQLREETDRIPEIRDALERWQETKNKDQKKAETLDQTLDYLQQARESLSGNYLGTIQRSFGKYISRMMGEDREKVLVTGDLEVLLERHGQVRELAYFSAGQTDLVMLCMRFALVDALFTDEKPFVILDDPFVNLDDERTAQALALLKELSRERQILYLVCNSSRV